MALEKLCDLGEAARPTLLELMKAADADLCQDILKAMREKHIALPSKQSMVAARVSVLADKDRRVRLAAVVILGRIRADSPAAVTALVGELQDAHLGVRVCRDRGPRPNRFRRLRGDHRSHRAIARRLPARVRSAAARALGRIGPMRRRQHPHCATCGTIRRDYVRQAAEEALTLILPGDKGPTGGLIENSPAIYRWGGSFFPAKRTLSKKSVTGGPLP